MTETRLFDVAFGTDGADQAVLLTGAPVWEARQYAMRALDAERERVIAAGDEDLAATFAAVRERIQFAELGSIVFGHVERYAGHQGRKLFIALLPTGTDYRDAGQRTSAAFGRLTTRPLFTPSTEAT